MGIGNRRVGKLLPIPVTPSDTICIQIEVPNAVEYIAAFFGQLDVLGAWYTWDHPSDGTECEDCEEAAQLWRTAIYDAQRSKGMCCCGEPTTTERNELNNYMTITANYYDETYNTWNDAGQTIASIAPNLDFSTGVPADIDKIICTNVSIILRTIIDSAIAYKKAATQEKKDLHRNLADVIAALAAAGGAAIAAGGILAAGMAFLGGPLTVFGLAMAAVGLFIANAIETTDLSVFQDTAATEEVRCTMVQNVVGEDLTRARFMGALSPNHFEAGSNAEKLAAVIQPYLDDLNVYLQFLVEANGLYDAVDIGALPECEVCPTEENCFAVGFEPAQSPIGTLTYQTATYVEITPSSTAIPGYWIANGNMPAGEHCHFDHYQIMSGTFTGGGGSPEGFGATQWPSGTNETDIDRTNYDVSSMYYISTTAYTIRIYIG